MLVNFISDTKNRYFLVSLLCCTLAILIQWAILPDSYTSDTGDGIWHYLLARYSYSNPAFELDLWAKPVFTMIAAPFAQFGLKGIHIMQLLFAFFTSIVLFKIASIFNVKHLWLIPVLLFFTPVYFPEIFSGLTEIVFAFFVVLGIYLTLIDELFFAAVLLSFLPFVRQEGYFIFPLITALLLAQKKYFHIPLLLSGYVLITLYGYSTHHTLLWVSNNNPYTGAFDLYGKGDFFFYINRLDELLGTTRKCLFYTGALISLYMLVNGLFTYKKNNIPQNKLFHFHFLTLGFIVLFILAESAFWAFGLFGALGMDRLIVAIVPLIVLIILFGLDTIYTFAVTYNFSKVYHVVLTLTLLFLINIIFKQHAWPQELKDEPLVVSDACTWYKTKHAHEKGKIYFSHPYTIIGLDLNPYDTKNSQETFAITDKSHPENNLQSGDIVVWDAHFGSNESRLPLASFTQNPNFIVLNSFHPADPFTVLGDHPFAVYVFKRK